MKRSAVASLAVVVVGAVRALGQTDAATDGNGTPLPRTVYRIGPVPAKPAGSPATRSPYGKQVPETSTPTPTVVPATTQEQPAERPKPVAKPAKMTPVKATQVEPAEPPPYIPPPVADEPLPAVLSDLRGDDSPSGYATDLVKPPFPWTKAGRRFCGSVYMPTPYFWVDFNYMASWIKPDRTLQPLVTAGRNGAERPGALDDPGTTVLFDGRNLHEEPFWGGKFSIGKWFDECQYCGLEGGYFFLASQDRGFIASQLGAPGLPGLYLPFFNPLTGIQDAFQIAQDGRSSGIVEINSRTRVQNAEGHFLFSFGRGLTWRSDAIVGVRWMVLDEEIVVQETLRANTGGTIIGILDTFTTRNDFIGADLGFKTQFRWDCWYLNVITRVALGGNHQQISNDGFTGATTPAGETTTARAGRYTGPANIGNFNNDVFAVVPEVGFQLGYQPRNWLRVSMGYNWLYWDNIVRPGGNIDPVVNPIGVPTSGQFNPNTLYEPRRPGVPYNLTDFWVQSVTVGIELLY